MISIDNLTKRYGEHKALQAVGLELKERESLGLVGPSGSGKTSLLRLIAGLERPSEGRIVIDGVEVSTFSKMAVPSERKLSMIFQDLALWPHMTVRQHIEFTLKSEKLSRDERLSKTKKILESVNLTRYIDRAPHQLSGGEKQCLAIARALASKPKYLLMDEPFASLDPVLKKELQELIFTIKKKQNISIIYVTHNIEEVFAFADRIAIMNRGKLEIDEDIEGMMTWPKHEAVRQLLGAR